MLLRHQLRERRPFEARKDYIKEALELARGHGWAAFRELSSLATQMLDDSPKSRISLPAAAAATAVAICTVDGALACHPAPAEPADPGAPAAPMPAKAKLPAGPLSASAARGSAPARVRPARRVAGDERRLARLARADGAQRRRRLHYAD